MKKLAYIDGRFVDSVNQLEIISPITLAPVGSVPSLDQDTINHAFQAARDAFKSWRSLPLSSREDYLHKFTELLNENKNNIAEIMHKEIGKKVAEAIVEIERTITYIQSTIMTWQKHHSHEIKINHKISTQKRVPLGVVLAISPFNYPVNLSLAKIAPALLVGNTIVFKGATNGSLTGACLAELFDKAGIPAGVFNYVSGRGRDIGDLLTTHHEIDMITFTGGDRVGKNIAKHFAMKPIVLELGGNDAAYVRYDSDLTRAVSEVTSGAFGFSGQRCTAIKRVILHRDIAEKFLKNLVAKTKTLQLDPLITIGAANYVKELYDDALKNKDKIILDGKFKQNNISPIIIQTNPKSRIWKEEAFGPLLPIVIVDNDKDAIDIMNDSNYGLQNSLFTKDIKWAKTIAHTIESGTVNINAKSSRGPDQFPFSGIKDSGFGTQGIAFALESMTRIINIVDNQ